MKVLFVLPEFSPDTGGGICTYYNELLKKNEEWESVVMQGSAFDARNEMTIWNEVPVHYLKQTVFDKYKSLFNHLSVFPEFQQHLASAWAMYEQVQEMNESFDTVICTDWGLGFIPWIVKQNTPVIIHLHGSIGQIDYYDPRPGNEFWSKNYLSVEAQLMSYANILVTHSYQNIEFWKKRLSNGGEYCLIPPLITKKNYVNDHKVEVAHTIGLVVGRIQYWKGVIQLCEALKILNQENGLKIYWIGRDTYYHSGESGMDEYLTKKYPQIWRKIVIPLGEKSHKEIEEYYSEADFTIVPSTWDMFNISAVEHLMHKKPLICSSGAGVSDLLTDTKSVLIFDNTPEGLAASMRNITQKTPRELIDMGEDGFKFANTLFNREQIIRQHLEVIKRTVNQVKKRENLELKFDFLVPSTTFNHTSSKKALIDTWALKEIVPIVFERLLKKLYLK